MRGESRVAKMRKRKWKRSKSSQLLTPYSLFSSAHVGFKVLMTFLGHFSLSQLRYLQRDLWSGNWLIFLYQPLTHLCPWVIQCHHPKAVGQPALLCSLCKCLCQYRQGNGTSSLPRSGCQSRGWNACLLLCCSHYLGLLFDKSLTNPSNTVWWLISCSCFCSIFRCDYRSDFEKCDY